MGLVTAIFGGRPGMVSGGAGAAVIVLIALMQSSGLEYVFAAVALAEYCKFWLVCLSWVNLTGPAARNVWVDWRYYFYVAAQFKTMANGESVWLSGTIIYNVRFSALNYCNSIIFPKNY
jgi:SulP family sulfate permease